MFLVTYFISKWIVNCPITKTTIFKTHLKKVIQNIIFKESANLGNYTSLSDENNNSSDSTPHSVVCLPSTSTACTDAYLKGPDKPERENKRNVGHVSFPIISRF